MRDIRIYNPKTDSFDYYEMSKLADMFVGKDSMGRDVYVNDFVVIKHKDENGNRTVEYRGIVKWSAGKGVYLLANSRVHNLYLRHCVKIGNTHQHSDDIEAFRKVD